VNITFQFSFKVLLVLPDICFFLLSPSDYCYSLFVSLEQEKLYEWILRQHENGLRLTVADIASHIQVSSISLFLYYKHGLQNIG
jgi:hypothetical protein